jgi:lipopolysaccharide biosynthesis regulator YciM
VSQDLEELKRLVSEDPGDPAFYDLAKHYSQSSAQVVEAREILLKGINASPSHLKARLLLARVYYLEGLIEFSVRELIELYRQSNNPAVKELLESFGQIGEEFLHAYNSVFGKAEKSLEEPGEVLAEIKIEDDFDEVLSSLDKDEEN